MEVKLIMMGFFHEFDSCLVAGWMEQGFCHVLPCGPADGGGPVDELLGERSLKIRHMRKCSVQHPISLGIKKKIYIYIGTYRDLYVPLVGNNKYFFPKYLSSSSLNLVYLIFPVYINSLEI